MKVIFLIAAAGQGTRVSSNIPKQYIDVGGGKTIIQFTIESVINHPDIDHVGIIYDPNDQALYDISTAPYELIPPIIGGKTRQESIRNGLEAIKELEPDVVLIHDAARPFLSHELVSKVIDGLKEHQAVIPTLPVFDTIKMCDHHVVLETLDRHRLFRAQTPQGFHFNHIYQLHKKAKSYNFTDDSSIVEFYDHKVHCVDGEIMNYKITNDDDMRAGVSYFHERQLGHVAIRVGQGYDVHAFDPIEHGTDDTIRLGGVDIPFQKKLQGHSDADVALHAIVDALLGALGENDIGHHFPPSDERFKGWDSVKFLDRCYDLCVEKHAVINNIDVTIICEEPKIGPYKKAIQAVIGNSLHIAVSQVNVKATTTEKLGFTGRSEGIAAQAVACISMAS